MNRRDFLKFIRDGGAALAAAVTVGIPKVEEESEAVEYPESLDNCGGYIIPPELAPKVKDTNGIFTHHIPRHEWCGCDFYRDFDEVSWDFELDQEEVDRIEKIIADAEVHPLEDYQKCISNADFELSPDGSYVTIIPNPKYPNVFSTQRFDGLTQYFESKS